MDTHRTVYPYEKVGYSPPQAGPKYGLDEEGEPAEPPPPSYDDPSHFASPVAYPTHYPPPSSGLSDDQGLPHDFQSASPFSPGTPYNSQGVPSTTQNTPYPNRDVLYGNPDGQPGSQSALYVDRGASYRRIAYDNHGGPSTSREYWQRSQGMVHDNQDSPYTIQGMPFTSQGIQSTSHEQRHATYGVPHADQSDYLHRAASIAESTVSCYAPAPPSSVSSSDTSSTIGSRSIYSRSDTGSTTTLESVKSRTPVARSASMRSSPLIDSPPSSLQRSIPRNLSYAPFPPSALLAHSANLEDGFPILPPPSSVVPHPFVSHDVNERDWARFLSDVQSVETLAPVNRIVAGAAPMAVNFGIVGGYLMTKALEAHVKSKKKSPVADVIDHWNHYFFHPRCIDIILAQGPMCYTGGSNGPPPDIKRKTKKGKRHVKEYEDKSDDELSSKGIKWMDVTAPAIEVLEQQEQFHEEKRTRQQFGRDLRRAVSQKWRLVVSYKPYVL